MSDKMKKVLAVVAFLVPIIICAAAGIESMILIFGIAFACLLLYAFLIDRYEKSAAGKKKQEELDAEKIFLDSLATYDETTQILTLHARDPQLVKVLKVEERKDFTVKHEPKKLHVGAVTVGGVTTGGAYTTGDYNNISSAKKNGLCDLVYIPKGKAVRTINLTEELRDIAKESAVAEFLNGQQIEVVETVRMNSFEMQSALNSLKNTGYVGSQAANAGHPTLEKGYKILRWLTNG